ncbi:MAG TPA: hypothetical protein VLD65_13760, partial [Anaerolineales bacterium]|nr:hypothetical protein [Anaerolineales bacterium]
MANNKILIVVLLIMSFLSVSCAGAARKPVMHDWPVYVQIQEARLSLAGIQTPIPDRCKIHAVDLLRAWVAANTPEKDPFSFTDTFGKVCQGTFEADVLPLFTSANLWYSGAPS